jgi:hypothetical protein
VDNALWGIRLFSEKVDKLRRLTFTQTIINEPSGFHLHYHHETGVAAERHGPAEESIDAFVLTLRFFIQNNEPCSLRNMTKHVDALHAAGLISDVTRDKWNEAREAINALLDAKTHITETWQKDGTIGKEETYTRRRIMDVFVYGGFAHASREKKLLFDSWRAKPLFYPMVENEFVHVIGTLVYTLAEVKLLVDIAAAEAEARLKEASSTPR